MTSCCFVQVALETLEEFDWCLRKLETLDSAKSMGTMAQDKFRRLLSRELSYLSSNSRSGSQVGEWINRMTNYGKQQLHVRNVPCLHPFDARTVAVGYFNGWAGLGGDGMG